jgi:hypothetical protein
MMSPKLQIISLPPYNLSPTRVKRFTYVDKTTFVFKNYCKYLDIVNKHISQTPNTPFLDRLWDAYGNNLLFVP